SGPLVSEQHGEQRERQPQVEGPAQKIAPLSAQQRRSRASLVRNHAGIIAYCLFLIAYLRLTAKGAKFSKLISNKKYELRIVSQAGHDRFHGLENFGVVDAVAALEVGLDFG